MESSEETCFEAMDESYEGEGSIYTIGSQFENSILQIFQVIQNIMIREFFRRISFKQLILLVGI